jgi:DnaJ domain
MLFGVEDISVSLQTVFRYLVDNLRGTKHVRSVRVLDEGVMLVEVAQSGFYEEIIVYVLAGEISTGFIKKTLNSNSHADKHTLYILSLDLITDDGQTARMSEGLRLLLQAYNSTIYTYRLVGRGVEILGVRIDRAGRVTLGEPVNLANLSGEYAEINTRYILGVRKVAGFNRIHFTTASDADPDIEVERVPSHPLQEFYDLLNVSIDANLAEIKRAYRRKARQHHPDADKSPGATERMQRINDAYARILEAFEEV